jgi:hypothetical protein
MSDSAPLFYLSETLTLSRQAAHHDNLTAIRGRHGCTILKLRRRQAERDYERTVYRADLVPDFDTNE